MSRLEDEPSGWRELCAKLRTAKDPDEFQAILKQINRLLAAHENAHPENLPAKTHTPGTGKSVEGKSVEGKAAKKSAPH